MSVMYIYINEDNKRVKCLLLASFEIDIGELQTKKFLCFKRQVLIKKLVKAALVFIPWQHREKEIRFIKIDEILEKDNLGDEAFIKIDEFVSPYEEERPYYFDEFRIKKFYGYEFIYTYPNFIANIYLDDSYKCYELLYKVKPEFLSLTNGL